MPSQVITSNPSAHIYGNQVPASASPPLPPIEMPGGSPSGSACHVDAQSSRTIGIGSGKCASISTGQDAVVVLSGNGALHLNSIQSGSQSELRIEGQEVTLVVGGMDFGAQCTFVNDGGRLRVYGTGAGPMDISAQNVINVTQNPADMVFYVQGTQPVAINAQSAFYGAVYAPAAPIVIGAQVELYGSLVGRDVSVGSEVLLHYDEALAGTDGYAAPAEMKFWGQR